MTGVSYHAIDLSGGEGPAVRSEFADRTVATVQPCSLNGCRQFMTKALRAWADLQLRRLGVDELGPRAEASRSDWGVLTQTNALLFGPTLPYAARQLLTAE